jgi:ABC-2 type transport system ATP-binding protein
MIEIEHVTKRYGDFCAVDDLSLTVQPGEVFGFLGVNGAGKTTTLRMLAGILKPSHGVLRIGGFDIERQPREAKSITGFIPDRPYMYAKLTGREFLYFVSDLYSVPQEQAEQRVYSLLTDYKLTEWQDELIESYSHGMKQRLATCAALVHEPKVLIVDEPMVGLDPHGARLLKQQLRKYAEAGMSILLSTHSLNVAEEVSDRLAIIHRGKLIALGTLKEIRERSGRDKEDLEEIFLEMTTQAAEGEYREVFQ